MTLPIMLVIIWMVGFIGLLIYAWIDRPPSVENVYLRVAAALEEK